MPNSKGFAVLFLAIGALVISGCGSSVSPAAPPAGGFSDSSFSGMYAFSLSGVNGNGFFTAAGSLTADGAGNITTALLDFNGATGNTFLDVSASGTYTVTADGRGSATLNIPSADSEIGMDFVLLSGGSGGLVIRFDPGGDASGTLVQQNSAAFNASTLTGPFGFALNGIDANGNNLQLAGNFTGDGVSAVTSGTIDIDDAGLVTTAQALTGSFNPPQANGRGTLTLTYSSINLSFAYYVVDSTHLKLVETDAASTVVSGDAYTQNTSYSNSSISGSYAFTLAGGISAPFVAGGIVAADGNGNLTSGVLDINNSATGQQLQNLSASGTYSLPGGRGTLTLTTNGSGQGPFSFVIYPTSGPLFIMEIDGTQESSGSLYQQQSATFSDSTLTGTYGYNDTGADNTGNPLDEIAQFTADGNGNITKGSLDTNYAGSLSFDQALSGSYSIAANGRGTATFNSYINGSAVTQNLIFYAVSNSRVLLIEIDASPVTVGIVESQ